MSGTDRNEPAGLQMGFGIRTRPEELAPLPTPGLFRLLVIGDFAGQREDGHQAISLQGGVPASLPAQMGVGLTLDVTNHLGSDPDPIPVTLPIRRLSDFAQKSLVAVLEPARRAAEFRASLAAGQRPLASYPDLDKLTAQIGTAPAAPRVDGGLELDRLLGLAPPPPASPPSDTPAGLGPKEAVAAADHAIARQMAALRHHPRLEALESAWRGLWLLATQEGLAQKIQIDLLDVAAEDAAAFLLRDIVPDELEHPSRPRPDCILLAGTSSGDEDGLHRLAYAAAAGEALHVPVIASLAQDFFETGDPAIEPGWTLLRQDHSATWLTACLGDIVLASEGRDQPLWGEPGWAVATMLLQSIIRTDGPGALADPTTVALEGLDVHQIEGRTGAAAWPLRHPLNRDQIADLNRMGVLALAAQANRDRVFLPAAPSLAPSVTLPIQIREAQKGRA